MFKNKKYLLGKAFTNVMDHAISGVTGDTGTEEENNPFSFQNLAQSPIFGGIPGPIGGPGTGPFYDYASDAYSPDAGAYQWTTDDQQQDNGFNIPTDVFPTSTSQQNSSSASGSLTGINWNQQTAAASQQSILNQIADMQNSIPQSIENSRRLANDYASWINNQIGSVIGNYDYAGANQPTRQQMDQSWAQAQRLPGMADAYAAELDRAARYAGRQALQNPAQYQGVLNGLARRGILNSSLAGNAMSGATRGLMQALAANAYQAAAQGQQARMNVPGIMAQIASGLGGVRNQMNAGEAQYGLSAATLAQQAMAAGKQAQLGAEQFATQSDLGYADSLRALAELSRLAAVGSYSKSSGSAYQEDPLAPYNLMVQMFGLMS